QGTASPNANQATANAVASTLRASHTLSGYRIEIESKNGQVTLTGVVSTPAQKTDALNRARVVPGVTLVYDAISVAESSVRPVQYQVPVGARRGGVYAPTPNYAAGAAPAPAPATAEGAPAPDGGPVPESG